MIPIRQVQARLTDHGATFTCADFLGCVFVTTHDATIFYDRAIAAKYGDWILVWTEHSGYHFFHYDDIITFKYFNNRGNGFYDLPEIETPKEILNP